jgi:hypothetical protein
MLIRRRYDEAEINHGDFVLGSETREGKLTARTRILKRLATRDVVA